MILFSKEKKEDFFMVLDIGTEAVKCVIFSIKDGRIIILGAGLDYYDKYDVFSKSDIEIGAIENSIGKSIEEARYRLSFSSAEKDFKQKAVKSKNINVYLNFPSNIFKARIISEIFLRKKPKEKISSREEENILKSAMESARKKIAEKFRGEFGIIPSDIYWNSCKFFKSKIDGYLIDEIKGYKGKEIELKMVLTFMPIYYWQRINRALVGMKLRIKGVIHLADCVGHAVSDKKISSMVIDVGGEITQIFGFKDGELEKISEFKGGAKFFHEVISNTFGIDEESSRMMLEQYARDELSKSAKDRLKEIFSFEKNEWYNNLKSVVDEMALRGVFLSDIFLIGGASVLPDIKESLIKIKRLTDNASGDLFGEKINLKELKVEDTIKIIDSPQWSAPILLCCEVRFMLKN